MTSLSSDNLEIDPRRLPIDEAKKLPAEQRLIYFKRVRVNHPKLNAVTADIQRLALPALGDQIILLVGPPGVGKSAAIEKVREQILIRFQVEMKADPGLIPIVVIDAPSSGDRAFSWKHFYEVLLKSLQGQMQQNIAALRTSGERALIYRGTSLLIIDEGVHMLRGATDKAATGHIESLKSLGSIAGVTIVLSGAYDLLKVPPLSGQIARRMILVHFTRYMESKLEDAEAFALALKRLSQFYPVDGAELLESFAGDLMLCCNGCVGILKQLLERALREAISEERILKEHHLLKVLPTSAQLDAMLRETEEGEMVLSNTEFSTNANQRLQNFRRNLGEKSETKK